MAVLCVEENYEDFDMNSYIRCCEKCRFSCCQQCYEVHQLCKEQIIIIEEI